MPVSAPLASRWWLPPLAALAGGALASIPFWVSDLDLHIAHALAEQGEAGSNPVWRAAYLTPGTLTVLIGLGAAATALVGALRPATALLRPALYLLLVLGLGCGLLANTLLKDQWGRPRPRDTIALGGTASYLPPWRPDFGGPGRSFPSGHATVPMLGVAGFLLWRRNRSRLAWACLGLGLALTAWVGFGRMLAGAHWLSDVLWAAVLMTVVALLLRPVLGPQARS